MASDAGSGAKPAGLEALHQLSSTEAPLYLTPSPELSKAARLASEYLFASLNPYAPKSPFSHLLTEGFDAEQIWQQIDLQAQPLLYSLRRQVRNFEKSPKEIEKQFNLDIDSRKEVNFHEDGKTNENDDSESESEGLDDDDDEDEEEEEEKEEDDEEEEEEDDDRDERGMENEERENVNGVEDEFLKIKELEEYLVEDEAREYGIKKEKKSKGKRSKTADGDEEDEDEDGAEYEEDENDEEEDDELGLMGLEDDDDDDGDMENAMCACLINSLLSMFSVIYHSIIVRVPSCRNEIQRKWRNVKNESEMNSVL